jgi:parallel beta-helix repeat protein
MRFRTKLAGSVLALSALAAGGVLVAGNAGAAGTNTFSTYSCKDTSADSSAISTALAGLQPGGTLMLSGECLANISVPIGVTIEGTNTPNPSGADGTVINGSITASGGYPSTIRDMEIICQSDTDNGITLDGFEQTVTHVTIYECNDGIELNGTSGNIQDRITNNWIRSSTAYGFYVNDTGNSVTDGMFTGNWVSGGTDAIYMTNAAGWFIQNNHIYGESGIGIYLNRMYASTVTGNEVADWAGYGIDGTVQGSGAQGSVVDSNGVYESAGGTAGAVGTAIYLAANSGTCSASSPCYASVTGNTIVSTNDATGSYGIVGTGTGLTFASAGNLVEGVATPLAALNGAVHTSGS